ncbi:MAG TPA: hypothetical protein ENK18_12335 [Deltaproteobacteria bacterium]|nr:hypothetical protein [Deltaproteobacteria bacterium]
MLRAHPFYRLPLLLQLPLAVLLFVAALAPWLLALQVPLLWLAAPLLLSWTVFATTPLLRLLGFYRYYSPYLCVMLPSSRRLDIHLGTSFDHLLTMRPWDLGRAAHAALLVGALDGLLAIAGEVERGTLEGDVVVEGTSWFFTASSAERFGFELAAPTPFGYLTVIVSLFDILMMYSFTHGHPTFPPIRGIRRAVTTGGKLLTQRRRLLALRDRLARALPKPRPAPTPRLR